MFIQSVFLINQLQPELSVNDANTNKNTTLATD